MINNDGGVCPLCDDKPVVQPGPTRINGKIIFAQAAGGNTGEYARWISSGNCRGHIPEYSIQRFTFRSTPTTPATKCEPYYCAYYNGFTLKTLSVQREWSVFEDAAAACDLHFHTNRSD